MWLCLVELLQLSSNVPACPRYSVEIEQQSQGGGHKKKKTRRVFSLRDADDGWETIQEAQNAVATLALHEVYAIFY